MNRSDCPISGALDHLGDRWSLLIIRDIAFYGKDSYNALLGSDEGIATNVLSSRLRSLESSGILSKHRDPEDKRKQRYQLTDAGLALIPLLIEMILWSADHNAEGISVPEDFLHMARTDKVALIGRLRERIEQQAN